MDNPGWHAFHRANKEDEFYRQNNHHGPDGHWQSAQGGPMMPMPYSNYPYGDGPQSPYPYPQPAGSPLPPVPPPKDQVLTQPGFHVKQPSVSSFSSESTFVAPHVLATMSAIQRSRTLRVARMDPHLQFMCGPLLKYDTVAAGIWRGAALIVTADAGSVYDTPPRMTLEWDPDASVNLRTRSHGSAHTQKSFDLGPHPADPHSTLLPVPQIANVYGGAPGAGPKARVETVYGQEIWVYASHHGTYTFWRFNIEIPLSEHEMVVRYSINNGQNLQFHVPARDQNFRWAAHSCNGFSAGVNPDDFRGPGFKSGYDPMWVDLLEKHQEQPFHVLVGGGDQLYCDSLMREPEFQDWVTQPKPEDKKNYPLTPEIVAALDRFYFFHYCQHFRSGAFARANSSIPMVNMCDDHDLIDGFGSYPNDLQSSPVFSSIGRRGYFFFLLFQCFINPDFDGLTETGHPSRSTIIGQVGPYVKFPSHSFLSSLGPNVSILMLDCRAERKKEQVCSQAEYDQVFSRLYELPPTVQHVIVQLGIPIAYPRMVFLETALDSKLNPLVALGRSGSLGLSGFVNKFNAEAELLDDLNDHWTAKSHKAERNWLICQLQAFAQKKCIRVTFLSGDVHCAAVGVFKTLKAKGKQELSQSIDHRYMINIVTSAIVNTPPPVPVLTLVSSLATKVHKTLHHQETDETMLPLFAHDTDGTPRKQKHIMGRRNWCQVDWDETNGDLVFDIRVEKKKGHGTSVGYTVRTQLPGWQAPTA